MTQDTKDTTVETPVAPAVDEPKESWFKQSMSAAKAAAMAVVKTAVVVVENAPTIVGAGGGVVASQALGLGGVQRVFVVVAGAMTGSLVTHANASLELNNKLKRKELGNNA